MSPRIDAYKVVQRFGGRMELWRRLEAVGHHISIKTIEKWCERDSIPANRLLVLHELAKKEGQPLVLDEYLINTKHP